MIPLRENGELSMIQKIKLLLSDIQDLFLMSYAALAGLPSVYRYRRETLDQMNYIGIGALLLVLTASLAVGLVLALEWGTRLERFGGKNLMGRIVTDPATRRELDQPAWCWRTTVPDPDPPRRVRPRRAATP